jgi:hypothetical protein
VSNQPEVLAYSIPDAGLALGGTGKTKLYELIGQKKLKARSVGGRTVVDAQSVREFYQNCPPAPIGTQKQQTAA